LPQEHRQRKKRGILLATSGLMLALVVSFGLHLVGLTPFNLRDWLFTASLLLAVESLLWLVPHLGWDEKLKWDPHYYRLR
jgi:Kef-type K+ transport system membrane component KefB